MKNQLRIHPSSGLLLAALVLGLFCSKAARAAIHNFQSSLDPVQAGVPGSGSGFATLTLDDLSGLVTITSGSYSNLSGTTTVAHIHGLSGPGVPSGVLIALTVPSGATGGTISGSGTLTGPNITGMLNGLTYINIHSSTFAAGEIRGQNLLVPEPGSMCLAGMAGLIVAAARRQK